MKYKDSYTFVEKAQTMGSIMQIVRVVIFALIALLEVVAIIVN